MKTSYVKKMPLQLARFFLVCAAAFLFFHGCKKDGPATNDPGYSYFPEAVGHYCIYEVDSTVYDAFTGDTFSYRYQVKEVIESFFTDNEGRQAMRVERYKRPYIDSIAYDSLPWTISRVWTFVRTNARAEKVEENQRFIRLSFVPRVGKTWNGNAFNTIGEWEYKYLEVDEPYMINSASFDSTLLVEQKLDTNKLYWKWYRERYARHAGMIEKTVYDIYDDQLFPGSVIDRIQGGVIYNIKLVSWGPQ